MRSDTDARAELCAWLREVLPERFPDRPARALPVEPPSAATEVEDEWFSNLPALDAAGRLVRPATAVPPLPEPLHPVASAEPQLELAVAPPPPEPPATEAPPPEPPRRSRRAGLIVAAVAAVVALGLAALWLGPRAPGQAATLVIDSTPPGAEIRIGGRVIGTTPYGGNNTWVGRTEVELRLKGYVPVKLSFEGGANAALSATLKRPR